MLISNRMFATAKGAEYSCTHGQRRCCMVLDRLHGCWVNMNCNYCLRFGETRQRVLLYPYCRSVGAVLQLCRGKMEHDVLILKVLPSSILTRRVPTDQWVSRFGGKPALRKPFVGLLPLLSLTFSPHPRQLIDLLNTPTPFLPLAHGLCWPGPAPALQMTGDSERTKHFEMWADTGGSQDAHSNTYQSLYVKR